MKGLRVLAVLGALVLSACGDGGTQSPDFTPVVTNLTVTPASQTVDATQTKAFSATATLTTPPGSPTSTTTETNTKASWSSSDETIATIDASGVATGVKAGTVTITAKKGDISATATLIVDTPPITALRIEPATQTIELDEKFTFKAIGTFAAAAGAPVVEGEVAAVWTIAPDDTDIATIDATTGEATGVGVGNNITVTAVAKGFTATAKLSVTGALIAISITPENPTVGLGNSQQFTAVGTFRTTSDPEGPTVNGPVTGVSWFSATPTVATINETSGVAQTLAQGTSEITAVRGELTASTLLTVGAPTLNRLVIVRQPATGNADPAAVITADSVPVNTSRRYRVLGVYSNSTTARDLDVADANITWVSSNTDAAVVTTPGRVTTATVPSTATPTTTSVLSAAVPGVDPATLTLTITDEVVLQNVEDIVFDPSDSVPLGQTATAIARGRFNDGTLEQIPNTQLNWTSSDPTIAAVTAGTATVPTTVTASSSNTGTVNIVATLKDGVAPDLTGDARSATAPFTVTDAVCISPLQAPAASATAATSGLLCGLGLCSATDAGFVIDDQPDSFGKLTITLNLLNLLLGGSASFTVNSATTFPGGQPAGFVVAKPAGPLLLADVLGSEIKVETLVGTNPVESASRDDLLVLDLLGNRLLGGSTERALVSVPTTQPYDGLRITVSGGGLGVATLLTSVQVYSACAVARPPAED